MKSVAKAQKQRFVCPSCSSRQEVSVWENIIVGDAPQLKAQVLDGSLFYFQCAGCGFVSNLSYSFIYFDMSKKLILCHLPSHEKDDVRIFSEIQSLARRDNTFSELGFSLRIVRNLADLAEKIRISDAAKDDRIIEICKLIAVSKFLDAYPNISLSHCYFNSDADNEFITLLDDYSNPISCPLSFYSNVAAAVSHILSPSLDYEIIDSAWAAAIIKEI